MKNPWLDIPLSDYEGHMALPQIAQLQLLSDVFADALNRHAPRSIAILGCAGGNGLERISLQTTQRVVGIDINPQYVQAARERFLGRIPQLELHVGDIQTDRFAFAPVDLLFAGLVFEHVDPDAALANVRRMLVPAGILTALVQLPSISKPEISPSPFTSLQALSSIMHLVAPERLLDLAARHGYRQIDSCLVESAGGKSFQVQSFQRC